MGTKRIATEARREQIAGAALNLVANHGMKGLSMSALADHVGLVPSAIYRHFKNKNEVLDAVLYLLQKRFIDNAKSVRDRGGSGLQSLKKLLDLHVNLIVEYQALPRILFSDDIYGGHPERKSRLYKIITTYLDEVAALVRQGQREKRIREDLDSGAVSVMFLGLIQPSIILWHLSDGDFDMASHIEKAWPIFVEALTAELPQSASHDQNLSSTKNWRRDPDS